MRVFEVPSGCGTVFAGTHRRPTHGQGPIDAPRGGPAVKGLHAARDASMSDGLCMWLARAIGVVRPAFARIDRWCLDRRLAEDAVVIVRQKLPGSVRLVEALGILREPVRGRRWAAPRRRSPSRMLAMPSGGMQRAMVSAQMEGRSSSRTGEHGGLGLDPAPAGEVGDLGIAGEDDRQPASRICAACRSRRPNRMPATETALRSRGAP